MLFSLFTACLCALGLVIYPGLSFFTQLFFDVLLTFILLLLVYSLVPLVLLSITVGVFDIDAVVFLNVLLCFLADNSNPVSRFSLFE